MKGQGFFRRLSQWIFIACGIWLIGLGGYFMFARPSLLPEDLRYLGSSAIQVEVLLPHLAAWLRNVFTVMGGFIAGCGVLIVFVSVRAVSQCLPGTGIALGSAGLLTVATMSWTNFVLDSDFKWLLLAPAVAWLLGLVSYGVGSRTGHAIVAVPQTNVDAPKLLILTFIVSAGVGVFEVGLALRGKQELGLTPYQIALMFTECSLVMFVMQAIVFSPLFKPDTTRWLIAPALAVLASGLFLVPRASDFTLMLAVIGAVAASAGILSPILTYWISAKAGSAQGWELGKQTAAASLGVTLGSAAGGILFNVTALPGASFVLTAGLAMLGFLLSLGLPHLLVISNRVRVLPERLCARSLP